MEEAIDKAIMKMAEMARANAQPEGAMKYSQAALNLAHARSVLAGIGLTEDEQKPRRGRPPRAAADEA